jgi:hypothetical protein
MPYIVITTDTLLYAEDPTAEFEPDAKPVQQIRTAVATLDEARGAADRIVLDGYADSFKSANDDRNALLALPESGGTIGPLPDGTVIEVRPSR